MVSFFRQRKREARRAVWLSSLCCFFLASTYSPAARGEGTPVETASLLCQAPAAQTALVAGLLVFSSIVAVLCLLRLKSSVQREAEQQAELAQLRQKLARAEAFLGADTQLIVSFRDPEGEPFIEGELELPDSTNKSSILAFSSWLPPATAQAVEQSTARLHAAGESFRIIGLSLDGRQIEIEGRPVAGIAVLRVRDISEQARETARLQGELAAATGQIQALRALLDAAPNPIWFRDSDGNLSWVNSAFASAVEAKDREAALVRGTELAEQPAREAAAAARNAGKVWRGRAPAILAGERRILEIVETPAASGSAGMATDLSEMETLRVALQQQRQAHARTLDQLSTAVAIFDGSKQLTFHNAAYRQLFAFDQAYLEQKPTDSEILDRLRACRLLPEQADFRAWKADLLGAYQSMDGEEQDWFLPDGRTLRAVITPNPQGGVTFLFDDVTERYQLVSQYNASVRVQTETLDTLKEGVAVFGSDGRLKLCNPAFMNMWALDARELTNRPHVDRIAALCAPLFSSKEDWSALRAAVAGLPDQRVGFERRLTRHDDLVLDCASAPLPDGGTLLTFTDTTASVSVERALIERNKALSERNEALKEAERLRNDFVHHVSYELRSPLTNIIGFIQLLDDAAIGQLNAKQREYAGYIKKSSAALLALTNDILDLASIDADAMELSLESVDIEQMMRAAAEGVQDRLAESSTSLNLVVPEGIGTFIADGTRIRQILFNLLSNAIGFSSPGHTIALAASRAGDEICFTVADEGTGIPAELLQHVFDRFKTYTKGSHHRGAGLGLSIVRSFVELHGGSVEIASVPGKGTRVSCIFPAGGVKLAKSETEGFDADDNRYAGEGYTHHDLATSSGK
ncbi:MAG TPA: PAS-domain containing protein [Methylocella sp.]|nr:PAS-domain containing protein [Methylocella sp.]